MATLLERVLGAHHERQAVNFRDLVVQIADGIEPDPDLVARVLYDSQQDRDDLRQAVELLERRRQLRQQYERLPELAAERAEIERQILAADAVLVAAQKEYERVIHPLCFQMQDIREATGEGEKAKLELLNTCTDPILLDKLADVQLRLSKRREEANDLRRRVEYFRDWARSDRAEAEHQKMIVDGDRQVKVHLARAKEHERKASEQEVLLAKAKKIVADLEREEAAIGEQMLVP